MRTPTAVGAPCRVHWLSGAILVAGLALLLSGCHGGSHNLFLTVNTTVDGRDTNPGDGICEMTAAVGDCSLRAAIDEGNASVELVPIISIPPGTYTLTLDGTDDTNSAGDLDLDPLAGYAIITSPDLTDVLIDADGNDGVFDVRTGVMAIGGLAVTGAADAGLTVRAGASSTFGWAAAYQNAGAGIVVEETGVLQTLNATVSTNGSGGMVNHGWLETDFTTITENTRGGIVGGDGANNLESSVVSDQATGPDCDGSVFSRGGNLDSDGSCLAASGDPSDIVGVSANLEPLTTGVVPFHTPAPMSAAIDSLPFGPAAAHCRPDTTDQQRLARPVGPSCDRGAIETTRPPISLTVDTPVDAHDAKPGDALCDIGDGTCSLRAAIDETNAWTGVDLITIIPGVNPTLTVAGDEDVNAGGDLDVTDSLTIRGNNTTINATRLDRVLDHRNGNLILDHATLTGGRGEFGGGLFVDAGASGTLQNVTISNNQTTGFDFCTVDVFFTSCGGGGGGAGVWNSGTLVLDQSTVASNSSLADTGCETVIDPLPFPREVSNCQWTVGGGVGNAGTLTVRASTISGNSTMGVPLAEPLLPQLFTAEGAGIHSRGTLTTVQNSTVSGNVGRGGGGIGVSSGSTTVRSSTVVNNTASFGQALFRAGGSLTISGSVIGGAGRDCEGTITSGGYNLESDDTCGLNGPTDLPPSPALLGALANNGGPTATHLPYANSPALDAIPPGTADLCDASVPTDQRGVARPAGPACDIGAVEGHSGTALPPLALLVNTSADAVDANVGDGFCATAAGTCTLRAAIQETNAWLTADTITIAPGIDPTLTVPGGGEDAGADGDLDIRDRVTIEASGAVIDAAGIDRVFHIIDGRVEIRDATITGGFGTFDQQEGSAVFVDGGSSLVLRADTVTQNTADPFTATIVQRDGDLVLENSTVSNNIGGAMRTYANPARVIASTITDNTEVAFFGIGPSIAGSIIDSPGAACAFPLVVSLGHNLFSDDSCGTLLPSDRVDPEPLLGPLADNGGPTPTRLPFADSPAVDAIPAGTPELCTAGIVDQRGEARPDGPACDIGAVEGARDVNGGIPLALVVDVASDGHDATPGDQVCDDGTGHCPLRAAIDESNAWPATDVITIAPAIDPTLSLALTDEDTNQTGDLDITDDLTFDGQGASIDAAALDRVIDTPIRVALVLKDLTITGGDVAGAGGGLYGRGQSDLSLESVVVTGNTAHGDGGGIEANEVVAIDSTFSDNTAGAGGGGMAAWRVMLTSVEFVSNDASFGGGLAILSRGTAQAPSTITGSRFVGNSAGAASGGGLDTQAFGDVTVTDTTISGNRAVDSGGGLAARFFFSTGSVTLRGSTLSGNTAGARGGGAFMQNAVLVASNSTFSGNTAADGGGLGTGGVFRPADTLTAVTFAQNFATNSGNAIRNDVSPMIIRGAILTSAGNDCAGNITITSQGYNVGSDATCGLTQATDQPSASIALGPLTDNGGPTRTHLPVVGSAGIDDIPVGIAGLCDGSLPTDQRGIARPVGPACDVGAVEGAGGATPPLSLTVDSNADVHDADPGNGVCATPATVCTLRAAIDESNAWLGNDTITIGDGVDPVLSLAGMNEGLNVTGDLDITDPLTLRGNGATVDARGLDGVFHVFAPTTLDSLAITGGSDGAVLAAADLMLTNATVSGNEGGGGAGGVRVAAGRTTIAASTFGLNASIFSGSDLSVSGGSATVRGTVFSSPTPSCRGTVTSGGYNVAADASCGLTQSTDHPSTDALTESLGNNTGTAVFEPYANSPLVNAIPPGTPALCDGTVPTDQRGVARPQGGACDIGAVEGSNGTTAGAPLNLTVTSSLDQHDTNPGNGVCATAAATCTLRAAIDEANQWPLNDIITIQAGVNPTLSLAGTGEDLNATGDLDITDTLTIQGNGAVIDAALLDRGVHHRQGTLTLANLEIRRGRLSGAATTHHGGGVFARSALTLDRVTLNSNRATGGTQNLGGGLAILGAHVDVIESTFVANAVDGFAGEGGGLYLQGTAGATITNSTFSANSGFAGSVIRSVPDSASSRVLVTVVSSTFADNTGLATISGSGQSDVLVRGSVISLAPSTSCGLASSGGWNLVPVATCLLGPLQPGDVVGNPLLGTLANNGGPTQTRLPGVGSPAINAIPAGTVGLCDGSVPTDQRGVVRPQGAACDKGSVEQ